MENKINKILNDLYEYDKGLKSRESELREILRIMLESRPEFQIDDSFARRLKNDLMLQRTEGVLDIKRVLQFNMNQIYKWGGVFATVALIAVFTVNLLPGPKLYQSGYEVSQAGKEAFGELKMNNTPPASRSQSGGGSGEMAIGLGGGGGGTSVFSPTFEPITFKYVYQGEEFSAGEPEQAVYKRIKQPNTKWTSGLIKKLDIGLFDLSSFDVNTVQYINIGEDKEYGYFFAINPTEGTITINENWSKWPDPFKECRDQACFDQNKVKISDHPDDATIIKIAKDFFAQHGLSTDGYSEPVVMNEWRTAYELATDKSMAWVPDVAQVVFPIKINGFDVLDERGLKTGLYVGVGIRSGRVKNVSEISALRFERSDYAVETDTARLKAIAEKGGFRSYNFEGGKVVQINLDSPFRSYIRVWNYKNETPQELVVPALIFPVKGELGRQYVQNVVVPLTKQILDEQEPPITIMERAN